MNYILTCARCGFGRWEHHENGACYGICSEFIERKDDPRNETERLLNAVTDHIAGTNEQPTDPRAWDQLLIYCPHDALERRIATIRFLAVLADAEPPDIEEDCSFCFGTGRYRGIFGHNDPLCPNCNGTGRIALGN